MEWTIRRKDQIRACKEAWGVSYYEAKRMLTGGMVVFYTAHTFGKAAPDVVAVEYLGAEHKNALKNAYKEITPIECIKAL